MKTEEGTTAQLCASGPYHHQAYPPPHHGAASDLNKMARPYLPSMHPPTPHSGSLPFPCFVPLLPAP